MGDDIAVAFAAIGHQDHLGNFILQTAHAAEKDHIEVLTCYRDMTLQWLQQYGLVVDRVTATC